MWKVIKFLIVLALAVAVFGGGGYCTWKFWLEPREMPVSAVAAKPPPPPVPPDAGGPLFEQAVAEAKAGHEDAAVSSLERLIETHPESPKVPEALRMLGEIHSNRFFAATGQPEHVVLKGETLAAISARLHTNPELIYRANNLENTVLRIGQRLIIPRGDFSLVISKTSGNVRVLNGGHFFRDYPATSARMPAVAGSGTRVSERIAWAKGQRVAFGSKEYGAATRWVVLASPAVTLYTDWGADPHTDTRKPANGIGLEPWAMDELYVLVTRGTPVRIE